MNENEYRFRNEGDLLVLQIVKRTNTEYYPHSGKEEWVDATTEDLLTINFNTCSPEVIYR